MPASIAIVAHLVASGSTTSAIAADMAQEAPTVFGTSAEGSDDVHDLIACIARRRARAEWRRYGARTEDEAYGFFIASLRRRTGVFVARELARHRLRRVPFVGMTRAALDAYRQRQMGAADQDRPQIAAHDFYAYQVHARAGLQGGA